MVKQKCYIENERESGVLFHYAHFLCDCLFPELVQGIDSYDIAYRRKNIDQSLGNFSEMHQNITGVKSIELNNKDFNALDYPRFAYNKKEWCLRNNKADIFRNYIFSRFNINSNVYNSNFPEVLFVKRGSNVSLLEDKTLSDKDFFASRNCESLEEYTNCFGDRVFKSGIEKRETQHAQTIETLLHNKFGDSFQSTYFESMSFKLQVQHFNNAKLIVCSHGAVLSNMFFCKPQTKIIEIISDRDWYFFDRLATSLNINKIQVEDEVSHIESSINNISLQS